MGKQGEPVGHWLTRRLRERNYHSRKPPTPLEGAYSNALLLAHWSVRQKLNYLFTLVQFRYVTLYAYRVKETRTHVLTRTATEQTAEQQAIMTMIRSLQMNRRVSTQNSIRQNNVDTTHRTAVTVTQTPTTRSLVAFQTLQGSSRHAEDALL